MNDVPTTAGDWPEDFCHENGQYTCRCHRCKFQFTGHKRRVTCKLCDSAHPVPLEWAQNAWFRMSVLLGNALRKHHEHQSESLNVFLEQDGKPIAFAMDLGEAYQDSELYEQTEVALAVANKLAKQ